MPTATLATARGTASRAAAWASAPVVAFPNNVLGNGRTLARWQVRTMQALFLAFGIGELVLGSYIREWGLFNSRFAGSVIAVGLTYSVLVWLFAALAHLWHRNKWVDGGDIGFLSDGREITLRRLWIARALAVTIGGLLGYPVFLYVFSQPSSGKS